MGIEVRRAGVTLGRDGIVGLGVEQEMPQAVTGGFTPSAADGVFLGAKDGNGECPQGCGYRIRNLI